MNIIIDLPVKDEVERKELEQYLLEQAKKFLSKKEDLLKLVEADYDDMSEDVKKSFDELFDEKWNVRDFTRFTNVEDVF